MNDKNLLILIAILVLIAIIIIATIIPAILHRQDDRLGLILYNCAMGFDRSGSLDLWTHNNGTHTIDETSCKWQKNEPSRSQNIPEGVSDSLHSTRENKQIRLWENCVFGENNEILERYPAVCISDSQYEQPVIFSHESQWNECVSLTDSIIVEDSPGKCIAPNMVVYIEPT